MKSLSLKEIKRVVAHNEVPKDADEYGGGGLIITNDPTWTGTEQDIVILTKFSREVSWLVWQLQNLGAFPPSLGLIAQQYLINSCSLRSTLEGIIHFHESVSLNTLNQK